MCERANKRIPLKNKNQKHANKRNKRVIMYTTQDGKHTQKQTYTYTKENA